MKSRILLAVACVTLSACASVHTGRKVDHGGLSVSATLNDKMSSDYFELVEITLENRSADWITLKAPSLDFGEALNASIVVPAGERILLWSEAATNVEALREYNRQVVWGSVAVAGAVAAGVSGSNDTMRAAGTGAMAAGLGVLTVKALQKEYDKAARARIFPASHLYAGDVDLPPGLFLRRWVLIQGKKADTLSAVRTVNMRYTLDGKQWQVPLAIRGAAGGEQ